MSAELLPLAWNIALRRSANYQGALVFKHFGPSGAVERASGHSVIDPVIVPYRDSHYSSIAPEQGGEGPVHPRRRWGEDSFS